MDKQRSTEKDRDVELAAAGDVDAFERLYHRHVARVHSLARRLLGSSQAEDATQEVFIRAWRKLSTFRHEGPFGAWLARLARNLMLTRSKRMLPHDPVSASAGAPAENLPDSGRPLDKVFDLEAAIANLPEGARQVLVLRDFEGYTHQEIATMLGISVGTSKGQLHRARTILRLALGGAESQKRDPGVSGDD